VEEITGIVRSAIEAETKNSVPVIVRLINRVSKVYYVLGEVNALSIYRQIELAERGSDRTPAPLRISEV
jgi:hypothetical protein